MEKKPKPTLKGLIVKSTITNLNPEELKSVKAGSLKYGTTSLAAFC